MCTTVQLSSSNKSQMSELQRVKHQWGQQASADCDGVLIIPSLLTPVGYIGTGASSSTANFERGAWQKDGGIKGDHLTTIIAGPQCLPLWGQMCATYERTVQAKRLEEENNQLWMKLQQFEEWAKQQQAAFQPQMQAHMYSQAQMQQQQQRQPQYPMQMMQWPYQGSQQQSQPMNAYAGSGLMHQAHPQPVQQHQHVGHPWQTSQFGYNTPMPVQHQVS